jgi:transcriptional regulator with XRE-family HTH domain
MEKRGWGMAVTARRASLSHPVISDIVNLQAQPTFETCVGLAKAFEMPPEEVLRRANMLSSHSDARLQTLIDLYNNLSPQDRIDLIAYAEMRYRLHMRVNK